MAAGRPPSTQRPRRRGGNPLRSLPRRATQQRWARKVHAWLSMVALVLVLFFGATGLLLNHPDWTFGMDPTTTTTTGTLPETYLSTVDLETIAEYLRDRREVLGSVQSSSSSDGTLMASLAGPGATAQLSVDTSSGAYTATLTRSGLVAFVGDLHRGNAVGHGWGLVIDATSIVLVVIALTGLLIGILNRSRHWARDMGLATLGLLVAVLMLALSRP